jgi:hypothetical protein
VRDNPKVPLAIGAITSLGSHGKSLLRHPDEFLAARHVMKSFTMAYDESDPDYLGDEADLSCVLEDDFIEGANWALMSADFKLAAEVGSHYRTRPYAKGEGKDTDEEFICDHAVALTILAQRNLLWPEIAQAMLPSGLLLRNAPLP